MFLGFGRFGIFSHYLGGVFRRTTFECAISLVKSNCSKGSEIGAAVQREAAVTEQTCEIRNCLLLCRSEIWNPLGLVVNNLVQSWGGVRSSARVLVDTCRRFY